MRPTAEVMIQQNNNNNYPCLNVTGSTQEWLQKCSRASLPFPSRLELGLGDLPLIRGLRAWALFSKNRCKASGLVGRPAPAALPAGHGSSMSCPRPADVYLSEQWSRMGYGLPLGLDARQAGIGALVTVATLKTSEGSGKTQTQCLFLRTEKGSCLYSTAKPKPGLSTGGASRGVGGWLRGKTGDRSRDSGAGRRDSLTAAQSGANRARVRSGRRWRKSDNAAGRENAGLSKDRQQSSRKGPAEERQEEEDKGADSLQQERVCKSPRCCDSVCPQSCRQCGENAQLGEGEGRGESVPRGLNCPGARQTEQRKTEEEKGDPCEYQGSNSVLTESRSDLELNCLHPRSLSGSSAEETEIVNTLKETQNPHTVDDSPGRDKDRHCEVMEVHSIKNECINVHCGPHGDDSTSKCKEDINERTETEHFEKEILSNTEEFSDGEAENLMERVKAEEEEEQSSWEILSNPSDVSKCHENLNTAVCPEPPSPAGGSIHPPDHEACWTKTELENSSEEQPKMVDSGTMGGFRFDPVEPKYAVTESSSQLVFSNEDRDRQEEEERVESPSSYRHRDSSTSRTVTIKSCCTVESQWRDGDKNKDQTQIAEDEKSSDGEKSPGHVKKTGRVESEDNLNESVINRSPNENSEPQTGSDVGGFYPSNINHVGEKIESTSDPCTTTCAGTSTSHSPSQAKPDPSLPSLGLLASGIPCLKQEEEDNEEEGQGMLVDFDSQERKRTSRRELENQGTRARPDDVVTTSRSEEEAAEEEEDEFGVFMQADGEPVWSSGESVSASVPCGSRGGAGELVVDVFEIFFLKYIVKVTFVSSFPSPHKFSLKLNCFRGGARNRYHRS